MNTSYVCVHWKLPGKPHTSSPQPFHTLGNCLQHLFTTLVCLYQTCFTCTLTTVLIHWLSLLYRQSKIQNGGLKSRLHTITITIYGTLTWKTACDREDVALASVGCCVLFLLPISSMLRISLAVLGWGRKEGCIANTLVSFSGHQTVLLKNLFYALSHIQCRKRRGTTEVCNWYTFPVSDTHHLGSPDIVWACSPPVPSVCPPLGPGGPREQGDLEWSHCTPG